MNNPLWDQQKTLLVTNPFIIGPPLPTEELIWAGMAEPKADIEARIKLALQTHASTLILNYGPLGGGKSYMARYFSQVPVLESLSQQANAGENTPLSFVIPTPVETNALIRAIYLEVIEAISFPGLKQYLTQINKALGKNFEAVVRSFLKSEEFISAILMLANHESHLSPALKRYFLASAFPHDLERLGLSRKLESGSDMVSVLIALLNLFLYSTPQNSPQTAGIFIWLDDVEKIAALPNKQQLIFAHLIRDLLDLIPRNLTIFINFTQEPGGKMEEASKYLTASLWNRMRDHFTFYMNDEDMEQYILDRLNAPQFRPSELKEICPDEYFPFTAETIQYLCSLLETHPIPQHINEACSMVIDQALIKGVLQTKGSRIEQDFVRRMGYKLKKILAYR